MEQKKLVSAYELDKDFAAEQDKLCKEIERYKESANKSEKFKKEDAAWAEMLKIKVGELQIMGNEIIRKKEMESINVGDDAEISSSIIEDLLKHRSVYESKHGHDIIEELIRLHKAVIRKAKISKIENSNE